MKVFTSNSSVLETKRRDMRRIAKPVFYICLMVIVAGCLVLFLNRCQPKPPTPTPTYTLRPTNTEIWLPTFTSTIKPTDKPTATNSPTAIISPSLTPKPTATFTPTPTPTEVRRGCWLKYVEMYVSYPCVYRVK
jgi:hypothetical protein